MSDQSLGRAVLELTTDDRGLDKGLSGAKGKSSKAFAAMGKAAKIGAAGVATIGIAIGKIGWDKFTEQQRVQTQTAAALRSTGGAANVTKDHIVALSDSISNLSGVDDDAINSGENLLLTFTNIRNEAGKGNDVFDQTTKTMVDMSVALGQDMKSSAIQLGKALNDPIKGVTALQRVGVSFTDAQREQIKAMVESGNTMGAQKLILHELNKEFGGSAEAMGKTLPGQISIAKQAFQAWAADIVAKVIPVIQRAIAWLRDHWPEIHQAIGGFWSAVKPILSAVMDLLKAIADTVRDHWPFIRRNMEATRDVIRDAMAIVRGALKLVVDLIHGDWSAAWKDLKGIVGAALDAVKTLLLNTAKNMLAYGKALGTAFVKGMEAGLSALGEAFVRLVKAPLNALISAWNHLGIPGFNVNINMPGPIPDIHFGWGGISLPDIPTLDTGGIVTGPTLAALAMNNRPEAVVPLDQLKSGNMQTASVASLGNEVELGLYLGKLMKAANRRGIRFELV